MFDAGKCLRAVRKIPIIYLVIKGCTPCIANKISEINIFQLVSMKKAAARRLSYWGLTALCDRFRTISTRAGTM